MLQLLKDASAKPSALSIQASSYANFSALKVYTQRTPVFTYSLRPAETAEEVAVVQEFFNQFEAVFSQPMTSNSWVLPDNCATIFAVTDQVGLLTTKDLLKFSDPVSQSRVLRDSVLWNGRAEAESYNELTFYSFCKSLKIISFTSTAEAISSSDKLQVLETVKTLLDQRIGAASKKSTASLPRVGAAQGIASGSSEITMLQLPTHFKREILERNPCSYAPPEYSRILAALGYFEAFSKSWIISICYKQEWYTDTFEIFVKGLIEKYPIFLHYNDPFNPERPGSYSILFVSFLVRHEKFLRLLADWIDKNIDELEKTHPSSKFFSTLFPDVRELADDTLDGSIEIFGSVEVANVFREFVFGEAEENPLQDLMDEFDIDAESSGSESEAEFNQVLKDALNSMQETD